MKYRLGSSLRAFSQYRQPVVFGASMRGQRAIVVCRLCWVLLLLGLFVASCGTDSSAGDREDREEMLAVMRQEIVEALPEASPTRI